MNVFSRLINRIEIFGRTKILKAQDKIYTQYFKDLNENFIRFLSKISNCTPPTNWPNNNLPME